MKALLVYLLVLLPLSRTYKQLPQVESAQLILYREKEFISGLGKAYSFKVNDQKVGKLSPNRYVQLSLPPGRTKIEFYTDYFSDSRPLWLSLQAGQTYYVKAVVEVDFLSTLMLMAPVDARQASQELRRMKAQGGSTTRLPE